MCTPTAPPRSDCTVGNTGLQLLAVNTGSAPVSKGQPGQADDLEDNSYRHAPMTSSPGHPLSCPMP